MNRYSFSGADSKPYVYFDRSPEQTIPLESLHTISFSVHEAKGPARSLGFRGVRGFSRGVRTIAGSMIFIVVADHPLRDVFKVGAAVDLIEQTGWSIDKARNGVGSMFDTLESTNLLPTLLPPFNLIVTYVSEMSAYSFSPESNQLIIPGAAVALNGIEFIDDGMVTSVNDIVSEITYSFVARDMKTLSANDFGPGRKPTAPSDHQSEDQARINKLLQPTTPPPVLIDPMGRQLTTDPTVEEEDQIPVDSRTWLINRG